MLTGFSAKDVPYQVRMPRDAAHRRLRSGPPEPLGARLTLAAADLDLFAALARHGPLPTPYLYAYVRHVRRDYTHLQKRLTALYHGDLGGPYLTRPKEQWEGSAARYQPVVYALTPRARHLLVEAGRGTGPTPAHASSFVHQLMQACVAASFELGAQERGLRYISRADILAHPRCPQSTRDRREPFAFGGEGARGALIPDDVFGLEYPGSGFRFFAVEVDRNTESIQRTRLGQTAFGRKIDGYLEALSRRAYEAWGLPNLTVLTVTTNKRHAEHLLAYLAERQAGPLAARFAFAVEPAFGSQWRVPKELLSHLLDGEWQTTAGCKKFTRP